MTVEAVAKILNEKDNFLVTCHVQPDGDGLGSMLAIAHYLRANGKQVVPTLPDLPVFPDQYAFLPGREFLRQWKELEFDVLIALDCAGVERLGALAQTASDASLVVSIDHHRGEGAFGNVNLVDESACATALLVYNVLMAAGGVFPAAAAECLYVGLVTDTGRFQYSNTNAAAFALAGELLKRGVQPNKVFENLYERTPLPVLRVLGVGLEKIVVLPECGFAYTVLRAEDFQKAGAAPSDSDMVVDNMRSLDGINVVALIKETKEGKAKVSLRSKGDNDVAAVAAEFGGGGHKNAAGFVADGGLTGLVDALVDKICTMTSAK